jgi:phospholipase/carboxylesterase
MHRKQVLQRGAKLGEADRVLVMVHGRGASAEDIVSLAAYLNVQDFTILAPQATGNTWYPYSFLAPPAANEPWLSSAIGILTEIVSDIRKTGTDTSNIYFLGFSQGACLTLEFVARHADAFGGVVAFTGGLIGDRIYKENYTGDLKGTPIFIGTSDPDPHVPVERVNESVKILSAMNAKVTAKIYPGMGHTINDDELRAVNSIIFTARNQQH